MIEETVLKCALARVFLYKPQLALALLEEYGSVMEMVRGMDKVALDQVRGMLEKVVSEHMLEWARQEVEWCNEKGVQLLFYGEEGYPVFLAQADDPPVMLYYKGSARLDSKRVVSIVGTRLASTYGKEMCAKIIEHIQDYNPLIISGLAYGIDAAVHKCALEAGLETVAVLPNGIDSIYPPRHRELAARMVGNGGVLTEFPRGEYPQKMNFIKRNRIIAAIAQGTVVVESRVKGGSMITAEYVSHYNRDLFAVPGRVSDPNSFGCNYLISKNVAAIYNSPSTLPSALGWDEIHIPDSLLQPKLFSFEEGNKEKILLSLKFDKRTTIEQICAGTLLGWETVSLLLLELELEGKITVLNNTDYYLRR